LHWIASAQGDCEQLYGQAWVTLSPIELLKEARGKEVRLNESWIS
jgi:hypothetical protein